MKQHPIPQNILDVEFKLFTRFTVREFAYMAIGIGFGGIWLYLFSNGTVPAIIAFPIFLISTLIGLGLALLPVNDQNADVFLMNFISAIRKPTLRVWRNENFDEKYEWLAEQRGITTTTGELDRGTNIVEQGNTRVIGGTAKSLPAVEFGQEKTVTDLDDDEIERLQQIEQIASAEITGTTFTPAEGQTDETVTPQNGTITETTVTSPTPNAPTAPNQNVEQLDVSVPTEPVIEQIADAPVQPPPQEQAQALQTNVMPPEKKITISKITAGKYATEVEDYSPTSGKIALYVSDRNVSGISQALVLIKDRSGAIIQALQTDPQGLLLPKKILPQGEYLITIQHDKYQFPDVNFIIENEPLPVVNIRSLD